MKRIGMGGKDGRRVCVKIAGVDCPHPFLLQGSGILLILSFRILNVRYKIQIYVASRRSKNLMGKRKKFDEDKLLGKKHNTQYFLTP